MAIPLLPNSLGHNAISPSPLQVLPALPTRSFSLLTIPIGYSVITYLLQIKDRHNGNILLGRDGHLIHIDFGFILSNTPGNIGFEAAPFKLSPEYIEVLGGVTGAPFLEFRKLFREGFEAARKHCDRIVSEWFNRLCWLLPPVSNKSLVPQHSWNSCRRTRRCLVLHSTANRRHNI